MTYTLTLTKKREYDDSPDLSYLGSFGTRWQKGAIEHGFPTCDSLDCREGIELVQVDDRTYWQHDDGSVLCHRWTTEDVEWEEVETASPTPDRGTFRYFHPANPESAAFDYDRMRTYGDQWGMVGVVVEATLTDDNGFTKDFSHALFGIESDSDASYFDTIADELAAELKTEVVDYISEDDFDAAWADVEWTNE